MQTAAIMAEVGDAESIAALRAYREGCKAGLAFGLSPAAVIPTKQIESLDADASMSPLLRRMPYHKGEISTSPGSHQKYRTTSEDEATGPGGVGPGPLGKRGLPLKGGYEPIWDRISLA